MQTIEADWYAYPQYYDQAYRSDTKQEADFIEAACRKYCRGRVRRLLEPACGSGRLVVELAARGYRLAGFDLCEEALNYLRRRLKRRKLLAEVFRADMADFRITGQFDAAFNTFSTFRHLTTEKSARNHLRLIARSLRRGGIYILGLHLCCDDAEKYTSERYSSTYRGTTVTVTVRALKFDRSRRLEILQTTVLVRSPTKANLRLRTQARFRLYDVRQFRRLLDSVPELELRGVHDFRYRIDETRELDENSFDTLVILRKSSAPIRR